MRVEQIRPRANERYPWNYRIDFEDNLWIVKIRPWVKKMDIPGIWTGSVFYTNDQGATMCVLRWS
jgi:hypothetical protein